MNQKKKKKEKKKKIVSVSARELWSEMQKPWSKA